MNAETRKRNDWQLSLANVLVFVFAVAVWGLLATQSVILERQYITFGVLAATLVIAVRVHLARQRAVMLLIFVYLFVILGTHALLRYRQQMDVVVQSQRMLVLHQIDFAIRQHVGLLKENLPPSTDCDKSGAELYLALMTPVTLANGQTFRPTLKSPPIQIVRDVPHLIGAFGARLLWARLPDGKGILIDMGPDNLPGGTLSATGIYTPGPVDANGDGINDGVDDLALFQSPYAK